jgi:hypothetical protein
MKNKPEHEEIKERMQDDEKRYIVSSFGRELWGCNTCKINDCSDPGALRSLVRKPDDRIINMIST